MSLNHSLQSKPGMDKIGILYNSGDQLVDAIAQINFQGNLIPKSWFAHIKYKNIRGEYCDYLAVNILSEIVYWYRPKIIKGSAGKTLGICKRFVGDKLRRTYESFATQFNATIKQVKSSIKLLKSLSLIELEFRTILVDGKKTPNVLYLNCNPQKIAEITPLRSKKSNSPDSTQIGDIPENVYTHSPNRTEDIADLGYTLIAQNPLAASFLLKKPEWQTIKENILKNTLSPKPSLSFGEEPEKREVLKIKNLEKPNKAKEMKPILRSEQIIKNPPLQQNQAFHAGYGVPEVKIITTSGEIITQTYTPIHAARRPSRAQLKYTYPDGPWLLENGCINQDFIRDRAQLWRTGDSKESIAFGKMAIEEVDALVQGFYMSNPVKLELHWGAYVAKNERYLNNVSLRVEGGIPITEAERQQILPKIYAVMQEKIPEFCTNPPVFMPSLPQTIPQIPKDDQKLLPAVEVLSDLVAEMVVGSDIEENQQNSTVVPPVSQEFIAQMRTLAEKKGLPRGVKFEVDVETELAKINSWLSDPILAKEAIKIAKNRGYEIIYSSYGQPDLIQLPPKPVKVRESVIPEKLEYPIFQPNAEIVKYYEKLAKQQSKKATSEIMTQPEVDLEIAALNDWLSDPLFCQRVEQIAQDRGYEVIRDDSGNPLSVKDVDF